MNTNFEATELQAKPPRRQAHEPASASGPVVPPWLTNTLLILFLAAVARHGVKAISDPDTFWHLRLGQDIIRARSLTDITEPWSRLSDVQWVTTQWLPEVLLALVEQAAGMPAVAWVFTTSLLGLVLSINTLCRQEAGALPAAFATALTIAAMSASLSPRPHMVTYLFLVVTLSAWRRTIVDLYPRWWLVPLTWVWAMSHGMWFVGPLMGLAFVMGLLLDRRLTRATGVRVAAVPVFSVVAAAITPVGPSLLGAPFAVAGIGGFITEWQPPSFRDPSPAAAALMVALVVVVWSRSGRAARWTDVAMLAAAVGWILLAGRTVALGALVMAPLVSATLQSVLAHRKDDRTQREARTLRFAAVLIACVAGLTVPRTAAHPAGVPSDLDPSLDALGDVVVFNAYELGGWLRWRHPEVEPVVDGMTEAYSVQHLVAYGSAQAAAPGWEGTFEEWSPEAALLPENSPLALALRKQRGWILVGEDAGYLLLTPDPHDG